ncbi:MAG TPA: monovalent cation/H(+) antiporter subunit G [Bacteroidales bacterium]|nr:monovalent cation/H(+) antiporter subunit G [Bacteroidales bacterium]
MNSIISNILIGIGLIFSLLGCLGLIRLPDIYNRLQAATKCVTLGACCILISLVIRYGLTESGIKGLLAVPVLFFTSTVGAHALIRGSHIFGIKLWDKSIVDEYEADGFGGGSDQNNNKE